VNGGPNEDDDYGGGGGEDRDDDGFHAGGTPGDPFHRDGSVVGTHRIIKLLFKCGGGDSILICTRKTHANLRANSTHTYTTLPLARACVPLLFRSFRVSSLSPIYNKYVYYEYTRDSATTTLAHCTVSGLTSCTERAHTDLGRPSHTAPSDNRPRRRQNRMQTGRDLPRRVCTLLQCRVSYFAHRPSRIASHRPSAAVPVCLARDFSTRR